MLRDARRSVVARDWREVEFELAGRYCGPCDEVVLSGADAEAMEAAFVRLAAEIEADGRRESVG